MRINIHQENIGILGLQGSGKTTLCRRLLNAMPNTPRVIISPQNPIRHYGQYGTPIDRVSEIRDRAAYVYRAHADKHTLERIANRVMEIGNMILVIDDVHEFCSKQKIEPNFNRLIQSGRNRGISSIFISPSPNLVNNAILQSCQHIFAFKMRLAGQIEWLERNYMGAIAEILLPSYRRKKPLNTKWAEIPKHYCLYQSETSEPMLLDEQMRPVAITGDDPKTETDAPPELAADPAPPPDEAEAQ